MKKRILFVDDNPNTGKSLKKMLKSFCREWDMSFATSGYEALGLLSDGSYEIIVTDTSLSDMTGNELLKKVKTRHPHMVRIIFSDQSENTSNMESVSIAHQILSRPYDVDTLKVTITKAFGMGELLKDRNLTQLINGLESIPSVPHLYSEIVRELENENSSIKHIGAIISRDIGMSTKVLQLTNSSFFGLAGRITSPETAAVYLGIETIKGLVLATGAFSAFKQKEPGGVSIDRIWKHSMLVGNYAMKIAREEGQRDYIVEASLLGGLLHDIGRLLLSSNMPDKYDEVLKEMEISGCDLLEAERMVFGTTHCEVGAYLLGIWGLPWHLVEILAKHHLPGEEALTTFSPLLSVHVADLLEVKFSDNNSNEELTQARLEAVSNAGFEDRLPLWRSICIEPHQCGFIR